MNYTMVGLHMWNVTMTTQPVTAAKLPLRPRIFSPPLVANRPSAFVQLMHSIEQLPVGATTAGTGHAGQVHALHLLAAVRSQPRTASLGWHGAGAVLHLHVHQWVL